MTKTLLSIAFALFFFSASAQIQDQDLLKTDKHEIAIKPGKLVNIFNAKKGELVKLECVDGTTISFTVNMNVWNQELVRTLGGKLEGNKETFITLTQADLKQGIIYEGNIISHKSNIAFKIFTAKEGTVYLQKTTKDNILVTD
ncbi:MAG: hypothetical protein ABS68_06380 [Niastella sp. SCN 39-18]|nr:hypothetical protein [Sphingobacteriales bacterium]ODT53194.1 MAG: hypothetical protein ABS68_06380 [Niastella sp. SCN 39-18]OJW08113.1 MAG: hypothetical protein BGO53_04450 [Sphingobacteriales bacterium 39-19]